MKKSRPKLPLRRETLRALSDLHLSQVVGGQAADAALVGDLTREDGCVMALKA